MRIENQRSQQNFGTRPDDRLQARLIDMTNKGLLKPTLKHLEEFRKIANDGSGLELTYVNSDITTYEMNLNDACPPLFLKGPLVDELVKAKEGANTPIKDELFCIHENSLSEYTLDNLSFFVSEGIKSIQRQINELKPSSLINPTKQISKNNSEIDIAKELKDIFG